MSRSSTRLQEKKNLKGLKPTSAIRDDSPKRQKIHAPGRGDTDRSIIQGAEKDYSGDLLPLQASEKPPAIWSRVRGRRGHLKMVVEMPFDILLEMFQYLNPVDLLNLSKASRAMRALLLDRSAALPVWKAAFAHIDLDARPPNCPVDLILPQYANLLYGRTCFTCDSIHGLTVSWMCYTRYCREAECIKQQFIEILETEDQRSLEWYMRQILPCDRTRRRNPSYSLLEYKSQVKVYVSMNGDQEKLDQYREQRNEHCNIRKLALGAFQKWESMKTGARKKSVQDRRRDRREAIMKKLVEIGYEDMITGLSADYLGSLPGVTGVKPLTDEEWSKLGPQLSDVLSWDRRHYAASQRWDLITSRSDELAGIWAYHLSQNPDLWPFSPTREQLAKLEPFRAIIYGTPADQTVDESLFMPFLDQVGEVFKGWMNDAEVLLLKLLPSAIRGRASQEKEKLHDVSALHKATALFTCEKCNEILMYPHVLTHACLTERDEKGYQWKDFGTGDNNLDDDPNVSWNEGGDRVTFSKVASDYLVNILRVLGEDPDTITWEDLDEANKRVECLRCRKIKGKAPRLVMNWREAILHESHRHPEDNSKKRASGWKALDPDSLLVAYEKEDDSSGNASKRPASGVLHCRSCQKFRIEDGEILPPVVSERIQHARLKPEDVVCEGGHDLTSAEATYLHYYAHDPYEAEKGFSYLPYPVWIPA